MKNQIESLNETKSEKDNLDTASVSSLEALKKSLQSNLKAFVEDVKKYQVDQKQNSMSLQQEISMLKKDKMNLYQKINGSKVIRNYEAHSRHGICDWTGL